MIRPSLVVVLMFQANAYIYIANGHGAWEAVISNVLSRGDKVLVLESGRFAVGWGQAARAMGADVESALRNVGGGSGPSIASIAMPRRSN